MADVHYKITWFFDYAQMPAKYASAALGWTETFYKTTSRNIDDMFQDDDVLEYVEKRILCLPDVYRIAWVRISDDDNPRVVKSKALDGKFGVALVHVAALEGEETPTVTSRKKIYGQVQCALLVDLSRLPGAPTGEPVHHRKFLMRALPSDIISGNVLDTSATNFQQVRNFLDWLAQHEVGTRRVRGEKSGLMCKFHNVSFGYDTLTYLRVTGPDNRWIVVEPRVGITTGPERVQIAHVGHGMEWANRTWNWLENITEDGNLRMVLGTSRKEKDPGEQQNAAGIGKIRRVKWTYGTFDQYTIIGLRSKKTGRLFHQLRGRSPNRE